MFVVFIVTKPAAGAERRPPERCGIVLFYSIVAVNLAFVSTIKIEAMASGHRLAFLIVEAEPAQGLSTRKLLLESAKHNVLTAYSPEEGAKMFLRFPHVDLVAVDGSFGETACSKLVQELKAQNRRIRIVAFVPTDGARCLWADETTSSHDPAGLLRVVEEMGGRTDIA